MDPAGWKTGTTRRRAWTDRRAGNPRPVVRAFSSSTVKFRDQNRRYIGKSHSKCTTHKMQKSPLTASGRPTAMEAACPCSASAEAIHSWNIAAAAYTPCPGTAHAHAPAYPPLAPPSPRGRPRNPRLPPGHFADTPSPSDRHPAPVMALWCCSMAMPACPYGAHTRQREHISLRGRGCSRFPRAWGGRRGGAHVRCQ
jgi:hypothetical protein